VTARTRNGPAAQPRISMRIRRIISPQSVAIVYYLQLASRKPSILQTNVRNSHSLFVCLFLLLLIVVFYQVLSWDALLSNPPDECLPLNENIDSGLFYSTLSNVTALASGS
jgi:hypothetical protein